MPNQRLSPIKAACLALCFIICFATASNSQPTANEAYQNQQRAVRLLQFDKEIRSIPEASLRIPLRFSILEFIYTKEVRAQYVPAEPFLTAYFEDVKELEKTLILGTSYHKNRIALLLRKHYPEMAKAVETKYLIDVNTVGEDEELLRRGGDPNEIVDRAIASLNKADSLGGLTNIYDTARRRSPEAADRLLNAVFDHAEKNPTPDNAAWFYRSIIDYLNPPEPQPTSEQMLRYYKILITAARSELSRAQPEGYYVRTNVPLRHALPKIEKVDPRLYLEGRSIVANYRKLLSKEQVFKEEADDRIEWAADRVAQAISEAESATTIEMKDHFWVRAVQVAVPRREGNRKPAIDLLMKASPKVGTTNPNARDQWLANMAHWAQSYRDNEGAKYAVDFIKDDQIRADASLKYANEFARWNYQDRLKNARTIDEAIIQIERSGPIFSTICEIGNSRIHLLQLIQFTNPQDMAARTVRIINMIPYDRAEANKSSAATTDFTNRMRNDMFCTAYTFRPVMPGTSPAPDPELANGIKIKELRLAAQIEAEKFRKYPNP